MSNIKLRCWTGKKIVIQDDGYWGANGEVNVVSFYTGYQDWNEVKDYQYMLSTSLKDKNGKEIFESDIIKYDWSDTKHVISYVDSSDASNLGMDIGFYIQRDDFESYSMLEVGEVEFEIIGNIYENPELLTNK